MELTEAPTRRSRRPAGRPPLRTAGRSVTRLAGALSATALALFALPVQAQQEPSPAANASMQQVIEAARRKKAQELEAAARRLMGNEAAPAATPAPVALPAPLPAPVMAPRPEEVPQIWSLSGVDKRLLAELYYQGQIHPVTMADGRASQVGPWQVRSITTAGVTVAAAPGSRAAQTLGTAPVTLPPPGKGSSLTQFPFASASAGAGLPGSEELPPSALRAAQLPLDRSALAASRSH